MGDNENDGYYCIICGGIPPDKITTKRVLIDGKETGIDHLDWIFGEVRTLAADNDNADTEEILKRVKQFNYVPTKNRGVRRRAACCVQKIPCREPEIFFSRPGTGI